MAALLLLALPPAADVRYRVELGGEHVGWARLAVACPGGAEACEVRWESGLRAPREAGGGVVARRLDLAVDRDGVARHVTIRTEADGAARQRDGVAAGVPATLAELLLSTAAEGERPCLRVVEEEGGRVGQACAMRRGPWVEGEVLGEPVRFRAPPGGLPLEVLLPRQAARFVADPGAGLPAEPPRLFGTEVAVAPGARWCGRDEDPPPPAAPLEVPRSFPEGASCRERTARYLAAVAAAGLAGRHAVGLAFDGGAMAWHEWAEVLVRGRWIPVDPSFGQAPAAGRRFTVARFEERDEAARAEAGRAVLACWRAGR